MDFARKTKVKKGFDELEKQYPHVLCLYKQPPVGEISLTEFEDLAYERMQVLRIIEQAAQMGNKLYSVEWRIAVLGYLRKQGLRRYIRLLESTGCSSADAEPQIRREDYISHFILRLAYCRSLELRNWFIAREVEFFKMRFLNLSTEGVKKFIKANRLKYHPITQDEKENIKDDLCKSTFGYSPVLVETNEFYKVPFTEVLDLIKNTSVYLHKGFAYIATTELVSCVISWLRNHLIENLLIASKNLPRVDDERITSLLTTLHASYVGKDYGNTTVNEGFTAENLHTLRKSMPMCMRHLYEVIKNTSHMKHFGRLQFGLFLKGIGLSLEESIKYWRSEFCKKMDEETFNKKHLYNIKHGYGTIGRMVSYSPFGCKKIISSTPGAGEHHGCPFKQWDHEILKQKMMEYGIAPEGAREVAEIAGKGHYQIACSKYFWYTHGGKECKQIINHPNQYFEESLEIINPNLADSKKSVNKKRKFEDFYNQSQNLSESSHDVESSTNMTEEFDSTNVAKAYDSENMAEVFEDDFDLTIVNEMEF